MTCARQARLTCHAPHTPLPPRHPARTQRTRATTHTTPPPCTPPLQTKETAAAASRVVHGGPRLEPGFIYLAGSSDAAAAAAAADLGAGAGAASLLASAAAAAAAAAAPRAGLLGGAGGIPGAMPPIAHDVGGLLRSLGLQAPGQGGGGGGAAAAGQLPRAHPGVLPLGSEQQRALAARLEQDPSWRRAQELHDQLQALQQSQPAARPAARKRSRAAAAAEGGGGEAGSQGGGADGDPAGEAGGECQGCGCRFSIRAHTASLGGAGDWLNVCCRSRAPPLPPPPKPHPLPLPPSTTAAPLPRPAADPQPKRKKRDYLPQVGTAAEALLVALLLVSGRPHRLVPPLT